jgi:hypothetical protein
LVQPLNNRNRIAHCRTALSKKPRKKTLFKTDQPIS